MSINSTIKLKRKKRYKPLYKKFNQIFENPQAREKIFNFKKKKWAKLQNNLKKKKSYRRAYVLFNLNNRHLDSYKKKYYAKRHRDLLHSAKKLNLFYGGLKRKYMKNLLIKTYKKRNLIRKQNYFGDLNLFFLDYMERRLETILQRSFFIKNIKTARQLIMHGYVSVNKQLMKNGSYIIKKNDVIEVDIKLHKLVLKNIKNSKFWPIPSKNVSVNYKTLQIFYTGFADNNLFPTLFNFKLRIKDVTDYYIFN